MHNLAAAVFAQGCTEIDHVLQLVGASRAFTYGLPGAGDLYVTCQGGRNMRLGRLLGLGHILAEAQEMMAGETLEGAQTVRTMGYALPRLEARGIISSHHLPLMRALVDIAVHSRPVELSLDAFFPDTALLSPWPG
jgi:glycerol-3-phosphate dehydrogenase (NAD(P)+)